MIACDVPSGVDASTGEVARRRRARPADGHVLGGQAGTLDLARQRARRRGVGRRHLDPERRARRAVDRPDRPAGGRPDPAARPRLDEVRRRGVLVCGGSTGLTGAPSLACEAAQRAGAGYVTALVPASLNLVFEQRLLEAMSVPLPDEDGALTVRALETVLARTERADALVLGPGIGRGGATQKLVRRIAERAEVPLLLDADGLNAVAGRLDSLAQRPAATVLTPHAGELGRLLERRARRSRPGGWPARARRRTGPGDRRAQGRRHARRRAQRARRGQPRRRERARHGRHRRRAVGRDRRVPGEADGPVRGRLCGRARPRPSGNPRRRDGGDRGRHRA